MASTDSKEVNASQFERVEARATNKTGFRLTACTDSPQKQDFNMDKAATYILVYSRDELLYLNHARHLIMLKRYVIVSIPFRPCQL